MSLVWHELAFPAEVDTDAVAAILRTQASEPRGGPRANRSPIVIETELRSTGVVWRVGAGQVTAKRLQVAGEAVLPGLGWQPVTSTPFPASLAVELRVRGIDRLLDVDQADAAARRLLGVLHELRHGEALLIKWQLGSWLVRSPVPPASTKRPEPTLWNVHEWGRPEHDSEQVTAARQKTAEHVFACVGRIAVAGATGHRAHQLVASVGGAMQLMRAPGVGVSRRALPSWWVSRRLGVHRVPSLGPACRLTASELAGLIGWPVGNPRLPGVAYVAAKALPLDERCLIPAERIEPGHRVLGESGYPSQAGKVAVLPSAQGLRHLHVVGPTGVGKSTLLVHLVLSDIAAGRSVVVIDPKDLVPEILARLPEGHDRRVVVLDPSEPAPVGFNPLAEGAVGIDGLTHVLRSIWSDSWGPRLGDVLHAGLLTLSLTPGHNLVELPLLLSDAGFRQPLVARAVAADPLGLGTFWPWFDSLSPQMTSQVLGPVMSRMRAVLLRPELRAVLGQSEPRFDLRSVFTDRVVLLVRLPKGQIGSEGAALLGSLLVASLWRLAQGRTAIPAERRHPVSLVIDEVQETLRLNVDLGDALVQARSLGLGITAAHQHLGQLDGPTRSALLANAGSRVAYRADYDDAGVLAKRSAGRLTADDLMGLPPFHAYAQVMVGDGPVPYGSLKTRPLGPPTRQVDEVLAGVRERFGVPRHETEQWLRTLVTGSFPTSAVQTPGVIGGRRLNGDEP